MGQPAAKQGDMVVPSGPGDTHIVMVPSPSGSVPTPIPGHVFNGVIDGGLSEKVFIQNMPVAVEGSTCTNIPPHVPMGGPSFQNPPGNDGTILMCSTSVFAQGKGIARNGDPVETCDDVMVKNQNGKVVAMGNVLVG